MGKNNVQLLNAVDLQQIKNANRKEGKGLKAIAKQYGISYGAAKCAVESKNVNHFKQLLKEYNRKENEAAKARRANKRQNTKAQEKAAEEVKSLGYAYTPAEVKKKLDAVTALAESDNERLNTVVSLLVGGDGENEDNVITRLTRLENRKGIVRRFLDKF